MLAPEDCKRARARIKSCSGIGAQWVAAIPTGPKTMLNDEIVRLCMRFRLGLETNALEFCPHVSAEGVACEHKYDRFGYPGLRDIYLDGVISLKNPRLSRLREQSWQGC